MLKPVAIETILEAAEDAVGVTRIVDYGHPFEDFTRISRLWAAYLGINELDIQPEDVAVMMQMVKQSRLRNTSNHRDSIIDIAGYARCHEMIIDRRESLGMLHPRDNIK